MLNEQYNRIKYLMGYDTSKPLTEQAKILNTLLLTESVNFGTFLKGPIQVMIREWVGGLMGAFEKEVIEKMAKELGSSEEVLNTCQNFIAWVDSYNAFVLKKSGASESVDGPPLVQDVEVEVVEPEVKEPIKKISKAKKTSAKEKKDLGDVLNNWAED